MRCLFAGKQTDSNLVLADEHDTYQILDLQQFNQGKTVSGNYKK